MKLVDLRAWAPLIAAALSACGGKVVVDGPAAHGGTTTLTAGSGGGTGVGGASGNSTTTGGGSSIALAYNLAEYVQATVWSSLAPTSAIDSTGRLFLTDGQTVFMVADGIASIYLDHADLEAAYGGASVINPIISLDVGPDDRLYILVRVFPNDVLVSSGPHNLAVHVTWDITKTMPGPRRLAVENPSRVLIITIDGGLYAITPEGTEEIYSKFTTYGDDCDNSDFTTSHDGYFYYTEGCNFTPLFGGKTDGTGAGVIKTVTDVDGFPDGGDFEGDFDGLAPYKGGGAVVNFVNKALYLDESGKVTELSMTPPMSQFEEGMSGSLIFRNNRIEIDPAGDIYFIGVQNIYKATPQ
jgi:hypothetical protein